MGVRYRLVVEIEEPDPLTEKQIRQKRDDVFWVLSDRGVGNYSVDLIERNADA